MKIFHKYMISDALSTPNGIVIELIFLCWRLSPDTHPWIWPLLLQHYTTYIAHIYPYVFLLLFLTQHTIIRHTCYPRSAFFFFCHNERAAVKTQLPDAGVGEIAKELGKRWAVTNDRPRFEEEAAQDKIRYAKVSFILYISLYLHSYIPIDQIYAKVSFTVYKYIFICIFIILFILILIY